MSFKTADLYDLYADDLEIVAPGFLSYGAHTDFHGKITTVKVHEDNVLVKHHLAQPGDKGVLVVDGGGSMRCALMGDLLAQLAITHDWAGIIVYGCIRDSAEINQMPIGVKALGTHPAKTIKRGEGTSGEPVTFGGVRFCPGDHVYCDADGIVVAPTRLSV